MASSQQALWTLRRCIRSFNSTSGAAAGIVVGMRSFSQSECAMEPETAQAEKTLDPNLVYKKGEERRLIAMGGSPIGSRRRRAAIASSAGLPFDQLPYQCFQEARKVLKEDRVEKLAAIEQERERIKELEATDPEKIWGGQSFKQRRIQSMKEYLEKLKILADINDPIVKKKFEDGQGDMNKPIYRYLADKKWRKYDRLILVQRITQMHIVPDVLPTLDPIVDISMAFGKARVRPGEFVDSRVSQQPPSLQVQVFNKGERLVTVAVVDSDVPDLEKDGFTYRCHYIASNIRLSPTITSVPLGTLDSESHIVVPWLPPTSQKGSPYHRLSIFILEQQPGETIDVIKTRETVECDGFILRSFVDKNRLKPVGATLFRTKWDEGMAEVMERHGIEGADIELKHNRLPPLPYKKKKSERFR